MATQALNADLETSIISTNRADLQGEVCRDWGLNGKTFMLGMNQRFGANSQAIRQLVDNVLPGEVCHAKARWIFRRSGIPKMGTWFGGKEEAGGGGLLDIGVHIADRNNLFLVGGSDPVSVSGATYSKFGHRGLGYGGWGKSVDEGLQFDVDDFASALDPYARRRHPDPGCHLGLSQRTRRRP